MGWTSYHAETINGSINRKKECDSYFLEGLNRGHFAVLKSCVKGSVYYAAIQILLKKENGTDKEIPEEERETIGVVMLTSTDNSDYYNFAYKLMEESCGPCYYDCPESILCLLSETDNEWALEWREKCRRHNEKEKFLKNCPVGTVIHFLINGEERKVVKCGPAYQFKTPFWMTEDGCHYVKKTNIPDNFTVVR